MAFVGPRRRQPRPNPTINVVRNKLISGGISKGFVPTVNVAATPTLTRESYAASAKANRAVVITLFGVPGRAKNGSSKEKRNKKIEAAIQ
jgi:hypothetical protein